MINGMSDHDAQILILHDITMVNDSSHFYFTREINEASVLDFNLKLSYESWDDVFSYDDINLSFNNFLNSYLRIFYSSFTRKKVRYSSQTKAWLTKGIKISCRNKRKLFQIYRNSKDRNDSAIKNYYKRYCKILADVIKTAKMNYYNNLIFRSTNKTKTTWNIINEDINKRPRKQDISLLNINGAITHDSQVIASSLNTYFSTVPQNIHTKNTNSADVNNPLNYLHNAFKQPIPAMKLKSITSNEIKNVVNSFKPKCSHGYDETPIKILKLSVPYILSPLTYLCNFISTLYFPQD